MFSAFFLEFDHDGREKKKQKGFMDTDEKSPVKSLIEALTIDLHSDLSGPINISGLEISDCETIIIHIKQHLKMDVPIEILFRGKRYINTTRTQVAEQLHANPTYQSMSRNQVSGPNQSPANILATRHKSMPLSSWFTFRSAEHPSEMFEIKVAPYHSQSGYSWLEKDTRCWRVIQKQRKKQSNPDIVFRPCFLLAFSENVDAAPTSIDITDTTFNQNMQQRHIVPLLLYTMPRGNWHDLCYPSSVAQVNMTFIPSVHQVIRAVKVLSEQLQWLMTIDLYWLDVNLKDLVYFDDGNSSASNFQPFIRDVGVLVSVNDLTNNKRTWPSRFAQNAGVLSVFPVGNRLEFLPLVVLWSLCCTALFMLGPHVEYHKNLEIKGKIQDSIAIYIRDKIIPSLVTHDKDHSEYIDLRRRLFWKVHQFMITMIRSIMPAPPIRQPSENGTVNPIHSVPHYEAHQFWQKWNELWEYPNSVLVGPTQSRRPDSNVSDASATLTVLKTLQGSN